MKTARVIKLWSKHNLPPDLLPEILSRLPVKSLLRFRCVSKSWLSLINDPNFCLLHLKNFKNNRDETHLLVAQDLLFGRHQRDGDTQNYVVRSSSTFRLTQRLDYLDTVNGSCQTFTTFPILEHSWEANCSLDGLVMLKNFTPPIKLILWNPSIRRARMLPPSPAISKGMCNEDLGFGYNPLLKDYQHVRFVQCNKNSVEPGLHSVAIYTFRAGSWKTIKFQGKGISNWRWSFNCSDEWRSVCFRGVIYFTAASNSYDKPPELVAFDLRDGVFASTDLPLNSQEEENAAVILLDDGSSLGVIYDEGTQGSIWVMETCKGDIVTKNWTMRYKFASRIPDNGWCCDGCFKYLKKNGDMILKLYKQVTSYNLETHEEKIMLANGRSFHVSDVWCYTESLLMLNA